MSVIVKSSGGLDLRTGTPGTADPTKILEGYTAWVDGELITGSAIEAKTVVQEVSGVQSHTFEFEGSPKAMLAEFGINGNISGFGTYLRVLHREYRMSDGSPSQSVIFGKNTIFMQFNETMGPNYTPVFRATVIY